ncbi:MAG: AIDA repeat-containing protein [Lentisphaeria bacterium]|nr:AIDA repeat-containing protein [Lentisphaeria bacterium]
MDFNIEKGQISSGIIFSNGSMNISSGGVASNTTVNSNGGMIIWSGGVASNTTVNSSGYMCIYSGGVANSTTVSSGGDMVIWSGGVANDTTVSSRGSMYIKNGGVASNTTVSSGGDMHIKNGGVASHTTVNFWGDMFISSGGVANNTTVSSGGYMRISSGGVANDTTVKSGGDMVIWSGGVANDTTVSSRGSMYIKNGGVASNTTVSSGGDMFIRSGGVASHTTVNFWGDMFIRSGGVANNTTISSGGWMRISSGGIANDTTVSSGGLMYISSGGSAINVVWTPCVGWVDAEDGAYITYASHYSGVYFGSKNQLLSHTASMTGMLVSGSMYVMSGGVANNTTVSSGGDMYMSSGGVANNTTVSSGGSMLISSGGVHRGSLYIDEDAWVDVYQGGIIDFSVNERSVNDGYLVNDLSRISGTPAYTITISNDQAFGTYKLAQGASGFSGSITIGDGTVDYGTLAVNGTEIIYNERSYSLDQADGNLTLSIIDNNPDTVPPEKPIAKLSTISLTQTVNVSVTYSDDSEVKQYSFDNISWINYNGAFEVSNNGTVYFRAQDAAGNESTNYIVVSNINKNLPEVPEQSEYCFVKKSYNNKITGKKQDGIRLKWQTNAVNSLDDVPEGMIAVLLDSKNTLTAIPDGIETIAGKAEILTINKTDYKANFSAAGTLNLNSIDAGDVEFSRFATVNVTDGAVVGDIAGGKENISETVKSTLKNGIATKTVTYKQTVTASGKVTVTDATAGNISGYSAVTLDNGVAGELVNSNVKISKSDKTVGGKDDTITHTTTYSASGTATLKNGSYVESISGFKTVKLSASTVDEIALGDSYTLKKGVKTFKAAGTVTLENATVGSIVGMNKVTAAKGFNTLESYTGSDGNDTLTINKNAVLSLGSLDMGAEAKDKFVNNGTLVLTGDFDRSFISGKGEIVAASDVYETLENKNGVLDLGATAEGFRTTKHENSDDTIKKAVKWDLKAGDYTGWLGSWQSGSDNVDFIKFTIGKKDVDKELCVSGVENFTLFDKKGNEVDIISAAGTYTLKLELDSSESTSYTLALA